MLTLASSYTSAATVQADLGDAYAWDHVSVSLPKRIPNWLEMAFIKSVDEAMTASFTQVLACGIRKAP